MSISERAFGGVLTVQKMHLGGMCAFYDAWSSMNKTFDHRQADEIASNV